MTGSADRRALQSFYAGAGPDARGVSVCRGLSCEINGAAALARRVKSHGPCSDIYCLGYCDRSPALLTSAGEVRWAAQALEWPARGPSEPAGERPDIRSIARQSVVTERIAHGNHAALTMARRAGVYAGLARALAMSPEALLATVEASGEQGRGGAGFLTGAKWRNAAESHGARRYVVANGDEGDPGSFIDRVLLEDDPHAVIEGLILCAYAIGAHEGVIFIRAEYPRAQARMTQAIIEAREAGVLGTSVLGHRFAFDLRVVSGHGSYVCGEETALLNAIEGRRGEVRVRPPYPAQAGLYGQPTVVNNIETLVNIPWILREGVEAYRRLGTATSPGTKAFCVSRGFARPGVIEAEFGTDLRALIEQHAGGGSAPLQAVLLGGPMGSLLTPDAWDLALDYATLARKGVRLGHGGIVAIPESAELFALLANAVRFMAAESCGKCVPCAQGSRRALELVACMDGTDATQMAKLTDLLATIEAASLCGFGRGVPAPLIALAKLAQAQTAERGGSRG